MSALRCRASPETSARPHLCGFLHTLGGRGGSGGCSGPRPSPPSPLGVQLPFRSSAPSATGRSQARMTPGKVSPSPTC